MLLGPLPSLRYLSLFLADYAGSDIGMWGAACPRHGETRHFKALVVSKPVNSTQWPCESVRAHSRTQTLRRCIKGWFIAATGIPRLGCGQLECTLAAGNKSGILLTSQPFDPNQPSNQLRQTNKIEHCYRIHHGECVQSTHRNEVVNPFRHQKSPPISLELSPRWVGSQAMSAPALFLVSQLA